MPSPNNLENKEGNFAGLQLRRSRDFFLPQMYPNLKLEHENCSKIITPFAVEKNGDELKWREERDGSERNDKLACSKP